MVVTLTHTSVNSVFYSAATALIRYIYIKTSLQTNIQAVIKRNAFMWKSVFIIESLGCYNLASFYLLHKEKRSPVYYPLLYQSCLDPWTTSYSLLLFKVMPINQFLIHAASWCIVGFNLILYKHLDNESRNNTALTAIDQIKIRRRNLVPAKVGIYSFIFMLISLPSHLVLYSITAIDIGIFNACLKKCFIIIRMFNM